MKRFALLLACTMMIASSGCCLFGRSWGGGCSPCSPYGAGYAPNYGAGFAPSYGGGCPSGACGQGAGYPAYQGGYPGAYTGGVPTAGVTYGYPVTAGIDPLPAY